MTKSKHSAPTWQVNQANLKLLAAGACIGLSIVFKHTFFIQILAALIVYLILSALLIGIRCTRKSLFSKDFSWMVLGFVIPLSFLSYWIVSNSLEHQFYDSISSMGGKNPQLLGITNAALDTFLNSIGNPISLALVAILLLGSAVWRLNVNFEIGSYVAGIFLFIFLSETLFFSRLNPTVKNFISLYLITFIAVAVVAFRTTGGESRFKKVVEYGLILGLALQLGTLLIYSGSTQERFTVLALPDRVFVDITYILSVAGIVFSIAKLKLSDLTSQSSKFEIKLGIFVFAIAISALINIASSGGGVYLIWMIGPFTWLFAHFLTRSQLERKFIDFGILMLFVGAVANISSGIAHPYSWWNWKEPSLTSTARPIKVDELSGILPATEVASFYEKLKSVESRAAKLSKSEDPKIFSFGGIPMASAISGLSPYEGSYCKFQWMDLCPQEVLLNDLVAIRNNSPDVIVIEEIPDSIISLHEMGFLKETSKVREYYSYAYSQARLGKWVKVGTLKQPQGNLVISVYYSTEQKIN